ncbi:beta-ketoacyl-ACP reductase [Candidatus Roizmanbacteria bacterium CG_4_8_14_3_um_filter_36_12]|nr:MAG: beta-ketoacyl-ACP reductase [Candidatus Roizmanbacteria bacterium CG_4_8_14_3_um_filter_36_12]
MFNLKGKKTLVTGASRGIGSGIALSLAKAGASVAINYHSKGEEAEAVVAEVKKCGVDSFSVQADVSNKEQVAKMFEEVKNKFGQLTILVNNAGIVYFNPVDKITEEEWDKVLDINLKGSFFCVQEAIKIMPVGGKIINISSIASGGVGVGFGNIAHYASSKGGVIAMVEDLAIELGPRGININAICPGVIETDMTTSILADEKTKTGMLARIPKGRFGKPEDIGATAVFLASDEADYITGSVIYVDGGWLSQ